MRGFTAFLGKELLETVRTWRIWVLPGLVLLFAVTGPPLARVTPAIIDAVGASTPGLVIEMPDPTWKDAYAQWVKNLSQIVTFAIVIIYGGLVSGEIRSGTGVLVLTKPLSRTAFVLAKITSAATLLVTVTILGAVLTLALTYSTFGEAPATVLAVVTGYWLAGAMVLLAVMTLLSTLIRSGAGAAGAGFGVLVAAAALSAFPRVAATTPVGLMLAPSAALAGRPFDAAGPLLSGMLLAVGCVAAAALAFARKEI